VRTFEDPLVVEVAPGEEFEIVLEGNFTSGYMWQLDGGAGAAELISDEMQPGGVAPGSSGTQHFKFKAPPEAGEVTLRFVYRRPWEDSIVDQRRVQLRAR
jgi:predicted secreted protein